MKFLASTKQLQIQGQFQSNFKGSTLLFAKSYQSSGTPLDICSYYILYHRLIQRIIESPYPLLFQTLSPFYAFPFQKMTLFYVLPFFYLIRSSLHIKSIKRPLIAKQSWQFSWVGSALTQLNGFFSSLASLYQLYHFSACPTIIVIIISIPRLKVISQPRPKVNFPQKFIDFFNSSNNQNFFKPFPYSFEANRWMTGNKVLQSGHISQRSNQLALNYSQQQRQSRKLSFEKMVEQQLHAHCVFQFPTGEIILKLAKFGVQTCESLVRIASRCRDISTSIHNHECLSKPAPSLQKLPLFAEAQGLRINLVQRIYQFPQFHNLENSQKSLKSALTKIYSKVAPQTRMPQIPQLKPQFKYQVHRISEEERRMACNNAQILNSIQIDIKVKIQFNKNIMDGFKNPFDEYEGDQMISINEPSTTELKKEVKAGQPLKTDKEEPQIEQQSISNAAVGQEKIETHYDGQQTIFMSRQDAFSSKGTTIYQEPPLLQDIGVDPELIADKLTSIIKFQPPLHRYVEQTDMFGPTLIAFVFGILLLLSGKMHFGDIYALFVIGNVLVFILLNLMSKTEIISLYTVMSTLGYCLLPMLFVGVVGIFVGLRNTFGIGLSLGLSGWCAYAASAYAEMLMKNAESDRKLLIAYPLYLYYVSFAMITIF